HDENSHPKTPDANGTEDRAEDEEPDREYDRTGMGPGGLQCFQPCGTRPLSLGRPDQEALPGGHRQKAEQEVNARELARRTVCHGHRARGRSSLTIVKPRNPEVRPLP